MRLYRTPLLKRFPEIPRSGRLAVIRLRLALFIPTITLMVVWVVLIRTQILPNSGPGWVAYRLHDYVYLPIKGWLFNRPYPYSLVGWLLILGTLVAIVTSILLDRSFILRPHRYLLCWVFTRPLPFGEYLALRGTSWLRCAGFQSVLLRRALYHEWLLVGDQLLRSPPGKRLAGQCILFARLTNWMMQIEAGFDEKESIKLLSIWHWAYVIIRTQAALATNADKRSRQGAFTSAVNRMLETAMIVFRDFQHVDDNWLEQPPLEDGLFSIEALGRDLCRLLYPQMLAAHPGTEPLPLPFENFPKDLSIQQQKALLARAVYCVDKRRFRLHAIALQIEQALQDPVAFRRLQSLDLLPVTPYIWQLALSVALHAALDAHIYRLGTAFFEAQDAAVLALSLGCGQYPVDAGDWKSLVSSFPRQEHYLASATLRQLALEPEKMAFDRLVRWDKDLIDSPDINLSMLGLHFLRYASGPIESDETCRNED